MAHITAKFHPRYEENPVFRAFSGVYHTISGASAFGVLRKKETGLMIQFISGVSKADD